MVFLNAYGKKLNSLIFASPNVEVHLHLFINYLNSLELVWFRCPFI